MKDSPIRQKRLFIHIPKNAGMSIRRSALQPRLLLASPDIHKSPQYSAAVKAKMDSLGDHHGFEHARWRDINPSISSHIRAFAIVRNPWDRVVSRYFFAKKVIEVEKKVPASYADVSSFEAFLEERHKWGNEEYMWHRAVRGWYPAFDHVTDEKGNIKCDILRFEHLNHDVGFYFDLKPMMISPRNVTGLNVRTYKEMYNDRTIQIIADWYKKDIDTWGFNFDTPARKNYWERLI